MSFALPCLVGLTLLLCGSVAALADLARERQPRPRPQLGVALASPLWIVRGPGDRWFVNGEPVSRSRLAGVLAAQPTSAEIRLLPSSSLPAGEVARSLAQLRSLSPRAVGLALPEGAR
jgi:hypothetical protein